jgi:hypothetical protein
MLTRIWISTLNMSLTMIVLALRRLLILRVLHHWTCIVLGDSNLQPLVCANRGVAGRPSRRQKYKIAMDSVGCSNGSRGCNLILRIPYVAEVVKLDIDNKSEFDNAMTRMNALLLLSQVSRWQSRS